MGIAQELTGELFNEKAGRVLAKALDPRTTYEMAEYFGHDSPRPVRRAGYDPGLRGTGVLAYYIDPQEVENAYPALGKQLKKKLGSEPVMGINPYLLKINDEELIDATLDHEKAHGAQPGKLKLKQIAAMTPYGTLPLGEMIIEGALEYKLEKRYKAEGKGKKVPSRHFDEMHKHGSPLYSLYRTFAYELEEKQPGVLRQIFRAAHRGGSGAAIRIIENVPDIGKLIEKYAFKLNMAN